MAGKQRIRAAQLCWRSQSVRCCFGSVQLFAEELHFLADELHQLIKLVGGQALGTIALGLGGVVVHLDHQAVGPGGNGSLGK